MKNCGVTDVGAQHIVDCLKINKSLTLFDVRKNSYISSHLNKYINAHLGSDTSDSSDESDVSIKECKSNPIKIM